jgi:hypothetical protein
LLPDDLYEEWTLLPRQALFDCHRKARLALATDRRVVRDYTSAIALITPLLAYDLADEEAHRELMHLFTLAGKRRPLRVSNLVDALAKEIDAPPPNLCPVRSILSGELAPPPLPVQPPWVPPTPIVMDISRSAPLVGRDAELEKLRSWLQIDKSRQGRTVFIAGDSGVGKTRLAYEALRAAANAGMITLLGSAYEQEGQLAYQPFIEAFTRYLVEHQRSTDENPISGFKSRGYSDPQQEQWALFNATAAFLSDLASTLPVVLLVDDLHAADEAAASPLPGAARAAPVVAAAIAVTSIPR